MAAPNPAVILVDVSGSVGQPGGEGIRSPDPAFNRLGKVTRQGWLKEAAIVRWLMRNLEATGATIHLYEFGSAAKEVEMRPGFVNTHESVLSGYDYVPVGNQAATNPHYGVELAKNKVKGPVDLFVITDGLFHYSSLNEAIGSWAEKVTIITFGNIGFPPERATEYGWELKEFAAETKKQSRPIVKGLANPRGVTAVYGTPIDWGSLPEKIRIGRRIANGRFKLEAHYPAKHFNDKKEYIDKRKAGSYCRFYDNKSPFFVARTVWDETSHPGMHMVVKNRNETYRFIVTPKANDPTEATVIGAYLVHRQDGVPVLCSGPIGELKAIGDDGDFKVTAYKKHGIRCPKKDSSGKDLAGEIPKTFGYTKRTSKKGPRKTAKDYCKPSHTFKHPTDIKRAEVVEEMDAYMDEQCTCLMCNWSGAYSDLAFLDDTPEGGPPGMDFMLVCPSCGEGDWLDDMMAEGYDEPCFSCDGVGTWDDGDCEYCHGSGMMSDNLRAEMAIYNSEYFDADCGCFKKAETVRSEWTFLWKPKNEGWGNSVYAANLKDAKEQILKTYPKGSSWFQRADLSTLTKNPTVNKERWSNWDSQWNAEGKSLSFIDWAKQEEASHLKKYGAESFEASRGLHKKGSKNLSKEDRRQIWMRRRKGSDFHAEDEGPAKDFLFVSFDVRDGEREYRSHTILDAGMAGDSTDAELIEWMYGDVGENWGDDYWVYGEMLVSVKGRQPITEDLKATLNGLGLYAESLNNGGEVIQSMADTFNAPYAGPGATMDIGKDTALSSFTPEELTTSSAIHGDFDQASLDYSGHQNIEVRAETFAATKHTEWECDHCYTMHDNEEDADECCVITCDHDGTDVEITEWGGAYKGSSMRWGCGCGAIGESEVGKIEWEIDDGELTTTMTAETFEAETICDSCEVNKATHRYNPIGTALLCFDCLEEAEEDDGGNMIPKDEESLYAESFGAERYGKRQRFGNRYVARNTKGEFISNVGVGASLKADRRNKSKTPARSGFGNRGDSQKTPPTWAKPLGYVGALAAGWISASMIDKAKE